jgi:hypothetical protein
MKVHFVIALVAFFSNCGLAQVHAVNSVLRGDTNTTVNTLYAKDTLSVKPDSSIIQLDTSATVKRDTLNIITTEEAFNTISGFRVQLMSTQNISEAMAERAKADSMLTAYNVYIIYDAPYYKVRAGDFRTRYEASQAAGYIASHGFPDAWLVPDNVFRNPQRKSNQ